MVVAKMVVWSHAMRVIRSSSHCIS